MTRSVVTGGAGFVGRHLCARLLGEGHTVVCVDNFSTGVHANILGLSMNPHFTFIECDVSTHLTVDGEVDYVFHLASPASPVDYLRLPIETLRAGSVGTFNALELSREKDARMIQLSTSEVYGDPHVHPQTETYWGNVNPVGPRSVYDEAKRFGEASVMAYRRSHSVRTGIVRIFNTYGPYMRSYDGRAIPTFIRQAVEGQDLSVAGDGQQTRSVMYVSDLIDGLMRFAGSDHPGPMNLGNPAEFTVTELASAVIRLTGSRSKIVFVDRPVDDPEVRRPDISLARRELGWEPLVGLDEGLGKTINHVLR